MVKNDSQINPAQDNRLRFKVKTKISNNVCFSIEAFTWKN